MDDIKNTIEPILKKYPIVYAGIFGSVSRGTSTLESDIDILIQYEKNKRFSLLTLIQLENELADALETKVDLVTEGGLNKYIKEGVLNDLKVIYGSRVASD